MENPVILSLGRWPISPCGTNLRVSPVTLRVIRDVKIQIQSLLPISFVQFSIQKNSVSTSKNELEEMYNIQIERRTQKVEILRGIWNKIKQKRSKSAKQSLTAKSSKLVNSKQCKDKKGSCKSFHSQQKRIKSKSKSPLFFKAKSPTKGSTYFDYYSTHKQTKVGNKKSYEEQSTQSRRQKTANASRTNQQYFQKNGIKRSLQKSWSNRSKQSWLLKMGDILKRWAQLQSKHGQELKQLVDLEEHQRKRLLKIHQIERQKLKKQIQHMKLKLHLRPKLSKGI